ncbi:DEAD/DEAH box helicase [Paenibacillus terrigena]|uniref:DEAD/DEAH box helicase n=1 Tax=Paenibacillus terrigena TaxID=369333 RepID=UPI0028D6E2CE|nr:DEAD/DEAH box helicase [Paenibacillus terrigena]
MVRDEQWNGLWLHDRFFCYRWDWKDVRDLDEALEDIRMRAEETGERLWRPWVQRRVELSFPTGGYPDSTGQEIRTTGGRRREVIGFTLPAHSILQLFTKADYAEQLQTILGVQEEELLGRDLHYWRRTVLFAQDLIDRKCWVPDVEIGLKTGKATWRPNLDREADMDQFYRLAEAMPVASLAMAGREEGATSWRTPEEALFSFLIAIIDSTVRERIHAITRQRLPMTEAIGATWGGAVLPKLMAGNRMAEMWWKQMLSAQQAVTFAANAQEMDALAADIQQWTRAYHPLRSPQETAALQLGLRLTADQDSESTDQQQTESIPTWHLHIFMQPEDEPNLMIPMAEIWQEQRSETRWFHRRFRHIQEVLRKKLKDAARIYPPLSRVFDEADGSDGLSMDTMEAYQFLVRYADILEEYGVLVQLPSWWTEAGRKRLGIKLSLANQEDRQLEDVTVNGSPSRFGLEQLLQFDAQAAVGDEPITLEELEQLTQQELPLVHFRGHWVEMNSKDIDRAVHFLKERTKVDMTLGELMHLAAESAYGSASFDGIPVSGYELPNRLRTFLDGDWMHEMRDREVPETLQGTLRSYQVTGYQWLTSMRDLGFGTCLADDMGLGKTIQIITLLLSSYRQDALPLGMGPALIICPTSLLGNWQRELTRFAPSLKVYIHHGSFRLQDQLFMEQVQQYDVILTTYNLIGRDEATFRQLHWTYIILDEAQNIKNEHAKQTQSILRLRSHYRVAVTGTPVENRLSELWSIFRFLNPGYLGSASVFRSRFATPIERDHDEVRLERLKRLVTPFVLRRVKTDPNISKDLPDKIETKAYCNLTKEQAALYQSTVRNMLAQIDAAEGMKRKGYVMASLTKLKQICNHPALFLQDNQSSSKRSGKMEQLLELVRSIREAGEAVLIFTQYVQMGHLLVEQLRKETGQTPLFLHGGVPKKDRDLMVDEFQQPNGPDIFVLSVKAGGVGLNLTRANHVIHFDRWWNPAVENQATDRAFRIGQTRNVQVHKLICTGTLEERIDEMIESKRALSEQVVGSGEMWITELSTAHLRNLLELREEALEEDDAWNGEFAT